MSFQKPIQYENHPAIQHSNLREGRNVKVAAPPKWVKNNTLCVIELEANGVRRNYWTKKKSIADAFLPFIGKEIHLKTCGDDRRDTDTVIIQEVGKVPPEEAAKLPKREAQPVREVAPQKPETTNPPHDDLDAKRFLCQASNLMRLCVKKANDIAIELDLPPEHRQGIGTTLFIQSDRMGYIKKMPIKPYTPEELGWGASRGDSLKIPQPEKVDE